MSFRRRSFSKRRRGGKRRGKRLGTYRIARGGGRM